MRLRATARIRNDYMISARKKQGLSQKDLAKKAGVQLQDVFAFEKLDYSRTKDPDLLEDKAIKIAIALSIPVEQVLPLEMAGKKLQTDLQSIKEVPLGNLLEDPKTLLLPAPESTELAPETLIQLSKAMEKLTFRERIIILAHFGLSTGKDRVFRFESGFRYSLEEIGKKTHLSVERVRQIERKALNKLGRFKAHLAKAQGGALYEENERDVAILDLTLATKDILAGLSAENIGKVVREYDQTGKFLKALIAKSQASAKTEMGISILLDKCVFIFSLRRFDTNVVFIDQIRPADSTLKLEEISSTAIMQMIGLADELQISLIIWNSQKFGFLKQYDFNLQDTMSGEWRLVRLPNSLRKRNRPGLEIWGDES